MRILYHHRTRGKGAEGVHIREIVIALRDLGHDVKIISFSGCDPFENAKSKEIKVEKSTKKSVKQRILHRIEYVVNHYFPKFFFEFLEILYNLYSMRTLKRAILDYQPDMIYERYSLYTYAATKLARKYGIPIIHEVNDATFVERVRPLSLAKLAYQFEKYIFSKSSGLIFITNEFQMLANKAHTQLATSIVTPNSVNLDVFVSDEAKVNQIKAQYGLDGKIVAGFFGNFNPWHGIDQLIYQTSEQLKQTENLVLFLVGDGISFEPIQQYISANGLTDKVILTGRIPHEDIPQYISAMSFSIIPDSNTFGSPMKLFESMALGVPVIAPDYTPVTDIVIEGETSWVFPRKDYQKCFDIMSLLVNTHEMLQNVSNQAKKYIAEQRVWSENAKDIIKLYEQVKK